MTNSGQSTKGFRNENMGLRTWKDKKIRTAIFPISPIPSSSRTIWKKTKYWSSFVKFFNFPVFNESSLCRWSKNKKLKENKINRGYKQKNGGHIWELRGQIRKKSVKCIGNIIISKKFSILCINDYDSSTLNCCIYFLIANIRQMH